VGTITDVTVDRKDVTHAGCGRKRICPWTKKDIILTGRGGNGKLYFSSRKGTKTDVATLSQLNQVHTDAIISDQYATTLWS
jgi:hypothetical protein